MGTVPVVAEEEGGKARLRVRRRVGGRRIMEVEWRIRGALG